MIKMKHVYFVVFGTAFIVTSNLVERAFAQSYPTQAGASAKIGFAKPGAHTSVKADCSFSNIDGNYSPEISTGGSGQVTSLLFSDTIYPVADMTGIGKIVISLDGDAINQVDRHGAVIHSHDPTSFTAHSRNIPNVHPSPGGDAWSDAPWVGDDFDHDIAQVKTMGRLFTGIRDWTLGPIIAHLPDTYEHDEHYDVTFELTITCYSN